MKRTRVRPLTMLKFIFGGGLFASGLFVGSMGFASGVDSLFTSGIAAYDSGNYKVAVEQWRQVLNQQETGPLLFNLGNAYFQLGKYPLAVLHYERAARLMPQHPDVHHNLQQVRQKLPDRFEVPPRGPLAQLRRALMRALSPSAWVTASIVTIWLTLPVGLVYLFSRTLILRRVLFMLAMMLAVCSLVSLGFVFAHQKRVHASDKAIIMAPQVQVRSTPGKESTEVFILHGGTKVTQLQRVRRWMRIQLPDERVGWVPMASLVAI